MGFKESVLQLIKDQGINQSILAKRLNKPRQNVSTLLKNDRPSMATIKEFAKALDVDPSELIGSEQQKLTISGDNSSETYVRLFDYFQIKNLHPDEISKKTGIPYAKLYSNALKGAEMTPFIVESIQQAFPDLNSSWMLSGEGEMMLNSELPPGIGELITNPDHFYRRLWDFMVFMNIPVVDFCSKANLSPDLFIKGLRGEIGAGASIAVYISKNFPQLNVSWLLSGRGNMITRDYEELVEVDNTPDEEIHDGIFELLTYKDGAEFRLLPDSEKVLLITPLIDEGGRYGYYDGYSNPTFVEEFDRHGIVVDKATFGVYRSFENIIELDVKSNSIHHYRRVIYSGRRLDKLNKRTLHHLISSDFVVFTHDNLQFGRFIDFEVESDSMIFLRLVSEERGEFHINLDEIIELYLIEVATYYKTE